MKHLTTLLLICCITSGWGQKKFITLQEAPVEEEVSGFYIAEVLDLREQPAGIGFERIRANGEKIPVQLARGLATDIYVYLEQALPQKRDNTPITLGIKELSVAEELEGDSSRKTVKLSSTFYIKEGWESRRLLESQLQVNGTAVDPTESLIRQALGQALAEFDATAWRDSSAGEAVQVEELKGGVSGKKGTLSSRMNLITVGFYRGRNATGWGIDYFYLNEPMPTNKGWFIPRQFSFERFEITEVDFQTIEYAEAQLYYAVGGISPFRRIQSNFYLNLSFKLIVGGESLTDTFGRDSFNFLLGLAPSQGIYWIPKKNYGLVIGISLYERLMTSQVYRTDIGGLLSVGAKF